MDTPSWPTTSLPPLVAMVLQEPSRVDLLAALSEGEASGNAQWPLAPVGPAQATLDVLRHAAETLGYVVPGFPAVLEQKRTLSRPVCWTPHSGIFPRIWRK